MTRFERSIPEQGNRFTAAAVVLLGLALLPVLAAGAPSLRPGLVFSGPDGQHFTLGSLGHRPIILHFFTAACRHCGSDDRLLRGWAFEYADRGVVLLNVYQQKALERRFASKDFLTIEVPKGVDKNGQLAHFYGMNTLAGTVFLNGRGRVTGGLRDGLHTTLILQGIRKAMVEQEQVGTHPRSPSR